MSSLLATLAFRATDTVCRLSEPAGMVRVSVTLLTALFWVAVSESKLPFGRWRRRDGDVVRAEHAGGGAAAAGGLLGLVDSFRAGCAGVRRTSPRWLGGLVVHVGGDDDGRVAGADDPVEHGLDGSPARCS